MNSPLKKALKHLMFAALGFIAALFIRWRISSVLSDLEKQASPAVSVPSAFSAVTVDPIEEHVVDLPDDGDVWHTTVVVHPDWQQTSERRVVALFEGDPALRLLKEQTKFHVMTTASPWYREIMAPYVPDVPAILLQKSNGKVVFKRSGRSLLREEGHDISRAMRKAVRDCVGPNCPWRPRPPQPQPKPKPQPIPDVGPKPDAEPPEKNPLLALLAALAGGAGGVASQWRKDG